VHLVALSAQFSHVFLRRAIIVIALVSLWLFTLSFSFQTAWAASPVAYDVSPVGTSVQPNSIVNVTLSVNTSIAIAGASIHIDFGNGSYAGFESSGTPGLGFVDYHEAQNDVVFICSNNSCAPGTYQIATITAKAGQSGNMTVSFVPKETADTQLNLVAADGTTGTYSIAASAPPSPASKSTKNIFTVPSNNGSNSMAPIQITDEELVSQIEQAQAANQQVTTVSDTDPWTAKNLVFLGLGFGAGLGILLFLLLQLFGSKGPGPKNPYDGGSGPGPTVASF
jgi:hypothetical protein